MLSNLALPKHSAIREASLMGNTNTDDYVFYAASHAKSCHMKRYLTILALTNLPLPGSKEMIPSMFASDSPGAGAGEMVEITVTWKNNYAVH